MGSEFFFADLKNGKLVDRNASFTGITILGFEDSMWTTTPVSRNWVDFEIAFYGRHNDWNKQLNSSIKFPILASEQNFQRETIETETGIKFSLSGSLAEGKLVLKAYDPVTQAKDQITYTLNIGPKSRLLKDGPRFIWDGSISYDGDKDSMNLPGRGQYSNFDIYPRSIHPSRLTGKR